MSLLKVLPSHQDQGGNSITNTTDILTIIDKRSLRIRCLLSVMIGHPNSGTSSLLMRMLKRDSRIKNSNGLDIYETILLKDYVKGESDLVDITEHNDKDDAMILLSLAKFLVTKHYKLCDFDQLCFDQLSPQIKPYFQLLCTKLFSLMKEVESSDNLRASLTRSHGFVSFFDINVNKAVYEIVFILGDSYSSMILFSVLNIFHYTRENLEVPLDLADAMYDGKYKGENVHLFKLHTALQYIVHTIEAAFASQRERGNAILVGTHADKFESTEELRERLKDLSRLIDVYAQGLKIHKALAENEIRPIAKY